MEFNLYNDINLFYQDTNQLLIKDESQNMILLGNIIIGIKGEDKSGWKDPTNWFMATITNNNEIVLIALMTPPHNLTLYCVDNIINQEAIKLLSNSIKVKVPGVISSKELALAFTKEYTTLYNLSHEVTMDQRIYDIEEVNKNINLIGEIRLINESDMYYFPYWLNSFTNNLEYLDNELYLAKIKSNSIYVLTINNIPVSMAGFNRTLNNNIGIAYVYTPPFYRYRGYATSLVAQITNVAFDKGYKRCVLYTNLANPISNSIYQKIGYKPVCDSIMLKFI